VLAASFVVLLALGMSLVSVVAASVAAAVSERWSRPLDDNFVLPPAVAVVIWILN
jgi:dolichol kinase